MLNGPPRPATSPFSRPAVTPVIVADFCRAEGAWRASALPPRRTCFIICRPGTCSPATSEGCPLAPGAACKRIPNHPTCSSADLVDQGVLWACFAALLQVQRADFK